MTKEPKRIRLTDFIPSNKEPNKIPLKSLEQEYEVIITKEGARILVKRDENHSQDDS
jgi:hypothetical protein